MATGIVIYEKDKYLLKLITERIHAKIPDAYVIDGTDINKSDITRFCDEIITVYNKEQFPESFRNKSNAVQLSEDHIIDISDLVRHIRFEPSYDSGDWKEGRLLLLIPFVYLKDRERFIAEELAEFRNACESCVRLDFTPRTKSYGKASGSLEELIKAASKKKFDPVRIMDYCVYDDTGFFTPGITKSESDITGFKPEQLESLVKQTKELTRSTRHINALVIAEDLGKESLAKMASLADQVMVLLPDRSSQNHPGMCELIALLSRSAKGTDIEIKTLENNLHLKDYPDEEAV